MPRKTIELLRCHETNDYVTVKVSLQDLCTLREVSTVSKKLFVAMSYCNVLLRCTLDYLAESSKNPIYEQYVPYAILIYNEHNTLKHLIYGGLLFL